MCVNGDSDGEHTMHHQQYTINKKYKMPSLLRGCYILCGTCNYLQQKYSHNLTNTKDLQHLAALAPT